MDRILSQALEYLMLICLFIGLPPLAVLGIIWFDQMMSKLTENR